MGSKAARAVRIWTARYRNALGFQCERSPRRRINPNPRAIVGQVQGAQTAALNPPPKSGTFPPIVIGMTPEIGPPLAAEAGVSLVWLAPALAGAGVHLSGVMPCTCADALVAGMSTSADAVSPVTINTRSFVMSPPMNFDVTLRAS